MVIRFTCPRGHVITAAPRFGGQRALCPKCRSPVVVPLPEQPARVTDETALAILGEYVPRKKRRRASAADETKKCPRCSAVLPATCRICGTCHVYLE